MRVSVCGFLSLPGHKIINYCLVPLSSKVHSVGNVGLANVQVCLNSEVGLLMTKCVRNQIFSFPCGTCPLLSSSA